MTDRLPHEKGFHISWDQIHRDSRALAWRLDGRGPDDGAWKAVVAITRGGMAPAMIVARELDIRTVDTISVMSYHAGGGKADQRREAQVLKAPDEEVMGDGTGVLIVDDLVDSGKTLELVRQLYPKAQKASQVVVGIVLSYFCGCSVGMLCLVFLHFVSLFVRQGVGGDHFGVEQGAVGNQPHGVSKVSVRIFHHGC